MKKPCWILEGATGEYSDRRDWPVRVFVDKEKAIAAQKQLNDWCLANGFSRVNEMTVEAYVERMNATCPYDPNFECGYTGTSYDLTESILEE